MRDNFKNLGTEHKVYCSMQWKILGHADTRVQVPVQSQAFDAEHDVPQNFQLRRQISWITF